MNVEREMLTARKMFLFAMLFFMVLLMAGVFVSALASNDVEAWRMYAVYDVGYDTGKFILEGGYGNVPLLQGCIEHSSMKNLGWDDQVRQVVEKLFFYGCINANGKKMTEKEFIENLRNLR